MLDRCQHLRLLIVLYAAMVSIFVPGAGTSQQSLVEVTLPRAPVDDEAVWLKIQVGILAPGTSIRVSSVDGRLFDSISPYGAARSAPSTPYLVPLPKTAIVDSHIQLKLTVEEPGKPSREPRANEVESVVPIYVPVTK